MNRFLFWQRWLFVASLLVVIFGLALAFLNQTPLFDFLFNSQINPQFWRTRYPGADIVQFQRWIYGVLGATMAGWGVFLAFVAHVPFRRQERWAWTCMTVGLLLWYTVDTVISVIYVPFNAAFNTVLLVALGLPLLLTWRQFRGR